MPPQVATCVHCRQMKVKCNARYTFPAACTRCAKQSLACSIDPKFHRIAKRQKLRELERELEQIKQSGYASSTLPQDRSDTTVSSEPTLGNPKPTTTIPLRDIQLGDVNLPRQAVSELTKCYFERCHPQFPILPEYADFMRTWDQSELLLCAIFAIAAKQLEHHSATRAQLEPHFATMAAQIYSFRDRPLHAVQALLLICWWPASFSAKKDDPSWLYAGQAVHMALQHGLHRPHHHADFVYHNPLADEAIKCYQRTWAGCFIINQMLSSHLGIPGTAMPGPTPPHLPAVLTQLYEVSKFGYHSCHVLGDNKAMSSGLLPSPRPTISAFEAQLTDLHRRLNNDGALDPLVEVALLRARLQLYSFSFSIAETPSLSSWASPTYATVTPYLAQTSSAAMSLINIVSHKLVGKPWPSMASIAVIYAVNILIRFLSIKGYHDDVAIRSTISQTWNLLNTKSEFEHDSFSRMCRIIGFLSRAYLEKGTHSVLPPASVTSRMAANVMFGNAWRAKSRFSQSVLDSRPYDYTAAAVMEEMALPILADDMFDLPLLGAFDMETLGVFS